jgi:hypothetical protein
MFQTTDRLMIRKWKDKKDVCLISTTHDDKMFQTRVQGQVLEKPKVITDYNSSMGRMNLSDTYLISYCSTRKRLKKYYLKHFCHLTVLQIHIYFKKNVSTSKMEFQVKLN